MTFNSFALSLALFITFSIPGISQTIAEKKSGVMLDNQDMTAEMHKTLLDVNKDLKKDEEELQILYKEVNELFQRNASEYSYQDLLTKINVIRQHIIDTENHWREIAVQGGHYESYSLWHQPETTIGQLVMDYGSQDYVYLVPADIASIKLSVNSSLPIPRASWSEILDLVLIQNGISFQQLNPFLRQLFLVKENKANLKFITNKRQDLSLFPPEMRVCFVLTPEPSEVRRAWLFLEKFVNPNSTVLQLIGRDILIIGQIAEIQDLLKLYDFVAANKGDKEYKVFPVTRVDVEEMAKILAAIFDQVQNDDISKTSSNLSKERNFRNLPPSYHHQSRSNDSSSPTETNGLRVIPLANIAKALFLVGTKEEIKKAEQIIRQVENQVGEARERTIFWYTTKHTDPEELAQVLQKIYVLMVHNGLGRQKTGTGPNGEIIPIPNADQIAQEIIDKEMENLPSELYQTSYYQQGNYIVNPSPVEPRKAKAPVVNQNRNNFIVDPKTGSIAMVVEADILPKIKELIKKLDVAKKMVQLEALLFERRINKQNNFGLNLLKIGDCASNNHSTCTTFNNRPNGGISGILDFIVSRKASAILPAYDLIYRFLMTQDDIQINASPSVVAVNQTPATIAIVEEISLNTGIYNVETAKGNTLEKAFTRTQYGITISITPSIHITGENGGDDDEPNYVSLETDLTFDTVHPGLEPERPDVTRRHITNEVRVPDGQTVILGGLRRKVTNDAKESIPFLGELPAIGKFFSMQQLRDNETEMFIFITPTIITDPLDDFERIKCDEMHRRPGDVPEFLCGLVEAREIEKNRVLVNSMDILLGPEPDRCYSPGYWRPSTCCGSGDRQIVVDYLPICGEYDGRG